MKTAKSLPLPKPLFLSKTSPPFVTDPKGIPVGLEKEYGIMKQYHLEKSQSFRSTIDLSEEEKKILLTDTAAHRLLSEVGFGHSYYCDEFTPRILEKEYPWHLDLFSTILSRKHSYHKRVGKLQYVKIRKEQTNESN